MKLEGIYIFFVIKILIINLTKPSFIELREELYLLVFDIVI